MAQTNIKNEILNATITVFNKKGMKFTMDDVAREGDRKSTRLNSSHTDSSRMPSSA